MKNGAGSRAYEQPTMQAVGSKEVVRKTEWKSFKKYENKNVEMLIIREYQELGILKHNWLGVGGGNGETDM